MARKKNELPSSDVARASANTRKETEPRAPGRPNTRANSSAQAIISAHQATSNTARTVPAGKDGKDANLKKSSVLLNPSPRQATQQMVDTPLPSSPLTPLPSPSHPRFSHVQSSPDDDDGNVADAQAEFSEDHFDESDDTEAAGALLRQNVSMSPGAPAFTNDFGHALNNAMGSLSSPGPPSCFSSPSFEASSSEEEYLEGLNEAISTAAGGDEQNVLMATKMQRLELKRKEHAEDARAYREWRANRPATLKGKAKEGGPVLPRRSAISKKDKEILKARLDVHNAEWEEVAESLGIEYESVMQYLFQVRTSRRNNKWCVWSRLYAAEHPGHGLDSNELAAIYKKQKAAISKKGKDKLADWFVENKRKLEELEGEVVFDSMSASTRSKLMVKISKEISETSRVCNNNWQFEVFGFILNRSILDGQATANSQMFSSSKTTAKILEKLIWNNMDLRKKLQLELMNVESHANTDETPSLEMWKAYRQTLTSGTNRLIQDDVRAAVSSKMMHLLRTVLESQDAEGSLPRGFPWNNLANWIYLNRPSFKIRNWPSTVPFSGIGEMNARLSRILLQCLVVGFIYQEEDSDDPVDILKPDSRIEFEPFNPSDEERGSKTFGSVVVMSDESGNALLRIRNSTKYREHCLHEAVGQKALKTKEGSRARARAHIVKGKNSVKSKKAISAEPKVGTSKGRHVLERSEASNDNDDGIYGPSNSGTEDGNDEGGQEDDEDDSNDDDHNVRSSHAKVSSSKSKVAKDRTALKDHAKSKGASVASQKTKGDSSKVQAQYSDDEDVDDDAQPPAHSKSNSGKNRATKVPKKAMMKPKASSQAQARYSNSKDDVDDDAQLSNRSKSSSEENLVTKVPRKGVTKPRASSQAQARYSDSEDDVDVEPQTRSKSIPKKNPGATANKKVVTKAKDTSKARYDMTTLPPKTHVAETTVVREVQSSAKQPLPEKKKRCAEESPDHGDFDRSGHMSRRGRDGEKVGPPVGFKKSSHQDGPPARSKKPSQAPASPTTDKPVLGARGTKKRPAEDKGEGPSKRQRSNAVYCVGIRDVC